VVVVTEVILSVFVWVVPVVVVEVSVDVVVCVVQDANKSDNTMIMLIDTVMSLIFIYPS
jgi:hypothetical protein